MITCYNQDLQRYNNGVSAKDFSKQRKNEIIEMIKETLTELGNCFYRLFSKKKRQVMDEIIYLLTATGVNTVSTKTLMKKYDIKSRTTIVEAVRALKESGEILVCRLGNKRAGTYVFVLKSHPNFKRIMKEVFYVDVTESATENPSDEHQNEHQNEHLQNAETVDTEGLEGEKASPILLIKNNLLKQDLINNIQATIETELLEAENTEQEERRVNEYLTERQKALYEEIKGNDTYNPLMKRYASIIALRTSNSPVTGAVFQTLTELNHRLNRNEVIESVPAYFEKVYKNKLKEIAASRRSSQPRKHIYTGLVPFFNWLECDEGI
jgi:HTH domain